MFVEHEIGSEYIKLVSIFINPDEEGFLTLNMRTASHKLIADELKHLSGNDNGLTPYDFLHVGLGSCTALTLKMYTKAQAAVTLALELNAHHGHGPNTDAVVQAARDSGLSEQEILEVVGHVAASIFTNTTIDFPEVNLKQAA